MSKVKKKAVNVKEEYTVPIQVKAVSSEVKTSTKVAKSKELAYGEVEVVASNSAIDRHGESIKLSGIDLSQVKRNNVLLWAHDYTSLPIGNIKKIWKESGSLKAITKLAYEVYDFADKVYQMIIGGYIKAVSVGGIVREWNDDYTEAKDFEMVELSYVPVGAHPDALVMAKSLGWERKALEKSYDNYLAKASIDKIKKMPQNEANKYVVVLKELTAMLEQNPKISEAKEPTIEEVEEIIKYKL